MKYIPNVNVKQNSVKILLVGLAIVILINLLARFAIIQMDTYVPNIITLVGSLFLLSEVAFAGLGRKRSQTDLVSLVIVVIAALAILGVISGWLGMTISALTSIQAIVDIGLLIAILVEIFRK